jgi:molybdenum cofactor cytidylyltransferase
MQALADAEAIVVVLGDQPLISTHAIERVIRSRRPGSAAVRATYGGGPGHPVLFERAAFRPLMRIRGDVGARSVLLGLDVHEVLCDGLDDPVDVDTPDDLRAVEDASG